jgi:outer membrane lipopolysaccharide assembly protein LptE/RlpB
MTTAFLLVSTVIVAACGYRLTAPDFPVLKLTSSTAAAPATATPPRGTE